MNLNIASSAASIRPATPADLAAVAALFDAYRHFYGQAPDAATATRFIGERLAQQDSVILLAESDDAGVAGFCQLYPLFCSISAQPIYQLSDLFVRPGARRTGTGRALLQAAAGHAARTGRRRLELTTAHTNHRAQSLYSALGWRLDTVYRAYSLTIGEGTGP